MSRLLMLLAAALPVTAAAAPKIVVFPIVPIPGEVELAPAQQMTNALVEELLLNKDIQVVIGEAPTAAMAAPDSGRRPARSDADYRRALGELQDGAEQAQKLRFPQAIKALTKGIDGLVANLDLLDDYSRLIDAYLLLSVSYFRRGKEADGTTVLEQVARLRPDLELDAAQYPPLFRSIFEKTRERALGRARASLRVTSAPAGANVWLNGKKLGQTPLLVSSIIPGANDLVVRLDEKSWAGRVEVAADEVTEKHANLGAGGPDAPLTMADAMAANRFDREVKKTARQLARNGGGDWVVVLAMGRGQGVFAVGGFLGNAKSGKWAALDPIAPDIDLLSASVEAHSMARDILAQMKSFSGDPESDAAPLIAGKSVQSPRKGPGLRESTAEFATMRTAASASAPARSSEGASSSAERRPIGASGERSRTLDLDDLESASLEAAGGEPSPSGKQPVAAASSPPPAAPPKEPKLQVEEEAVDLVPPPGSAEAGKRAARAPRMPLTRSGGGRGPVVSATVGVEIVDEEEGSSGPPSEGTMRTPVGAPTEVPESAIAAVAVDAGGTGPLAVYEVEAASGPSLLREWWFWTAVGGGVAAAALGGYFIFFRDSEADRVDVYAVW